MTVVTGLERLISDVSMRQKIKGNFAYLGHGASVDRNLNHGVKLVKKYFGKQFTKIFGPQHGFLTNVQDNMVESQDFVHPYFNLPVYSLYSHTRSPSPEMLEGVQTVVVDLQDVGTRVYTYIQTLSLLMESCQGRDIRVMVLDRPNPIGGIDIEGCILKDSLRSFVGRYPLPQRHGMTIGEIALWLKRSMKIDCDLEVVPMDGWSRNMVFNQTGLPWVMPSPNLPTLDGAMIYPGTVLFEGTQISEGRGTTRPLEIIGHPDLDTFSFLDEWSSELSSWGFEGLSLRVCSFVPTFHKFKDLPCQGFQIHIENKIGVRSWRFGQWLCRALYHTLGEKFQWKNPPYEYEFELMPIDLINGDERLKTWVEKKGSLDGLISIEQEGYENFINQRKASLLYK